MTCKCNSERIVFISAKCNDMFSAQLRTDNQGYDGYVPGYLGIGSGDYVKFSYCLDCGQIQGNFPLPKSEIERNPRCEICDEEYTIEGDLGHCAACTVNYG